MTFRPICMMLAVALFLLGACATTPPPSRFAGVSWYDGHRYVAADAYVRNGKFVRMPEEISETIALDGLYATSPDGRPLPVTGMQADFDLYARPPQAGSNPVARVRGGKRID